MGKLIPLILALAGLGGGVGAGLMLRPEPAAPEHHAEEGDSHGAEAAHAPADCPPDKADHAGSEKADAGHGDGHGADAASSEFVKFANQFVVPIMEDRAVGAMVVLSLSVEVAAGSKEQIFQREPKIRDAFLRVLFDHSNAGGFDGNFISPTGLDQLRVALQETAERIAGPLVYDVLIVDLVKQNV